MRQVVPFWSKAVDVLKVEDITSTINCVRGKAITNSQGLCAGIGHNSQGCADRMDHGFAQLSYSKDDRSAWKTGYKADSAPPSTFTLRFHLLLTSLERLGLEDLNHLGEATFFQPRTCCVAWTNRLTRGARFQ